MSYYCGFIYRIKIIFRTVQVEFFYIVLHFVKMFVWYLFVFNQYSYYRDLFCLGLASCLRERHHHRRVCYIDTTKTTVLRVVWYWLFYIYTFIIVTYFVRGQHCVFVISIVMCECAILIPRKLRLRVCHCWYCLLIYDDSFIILCFILKWPMVQWWNGAWWNDVMVK